VRIQEYFDHFLKGVPEPDWMKNGITFIDREQEKQKVNAIYDETGAGDKMK